MGEYDTSIMRRQTEGILTLLSGMRKVPVRSKEDIAYNNALGDVFDYFIENEPEHLYVNTIKQGKWVRDEV